MIKTLMICIGLIGLPQLTAAQSVEDQVFAQLQEQGFTVIEVRRTFLGRIRFIAESAYLYRELVINPQTGEILRDYVRDIDGDKNHDRNPRILNPNHNPSHTNDDGDGNGGSSNDDDDYTEGAEGDDESDDADENEHDADDESDENEGEEDDDDDEDDEDD